MTTCNDCDGKGWHEGPFSLKVECSTCKATGKVEETRPYMYGLNQFAKDAREISRANGFDDPTSISEGLLISQKLMLIVSECSEAMEAVRKSQSFTEFSEELADILIRTVDLGHDMGIDFDTIVAEKMEKNRQRGFRHGGRQF